jgi:hypothetical protein
MPERHASLSMARRNVAILEPQGGGQRLPSEMSQLAETTITAVLPERPSRRSPLGPIGVFEAAA